MAKKLTVGEGIRIQQIQLSEWKTILYPEAYAALEEYATRNNATAKSGYDICRGESLRDFIHGHAVCKSIKENLR
jgi:hypothetical protein